MTARQRRISELSEELQTLTELTIVPTAVVDGLVRALNMAMHSGKSLTFLESQISGSLRGVLNESIVEAANSIGPGDFEEGDILVEAQAQRWSASLARTLTVHASTPVKALQKLLLEIRAEVAEVEAEEVEAES